METNEGQPQYAHQIKPYSQPYAPSYSQPYSQPYAPSYSQSIQAYAQPQQSYTQPRQPYVQHEVIVVEEPQKKHNPKFHHSLFNVCSGGAGTCLAAFFCCLSSSSVRTEFDNSNCCFNCCCLTPPAHRNVIRQGYMIEGDCLEDICIGFFCGPCSTIQLKSEVKTRGPLRQQMK
jgi:hypothetical protein